MQNSKNSPQKNGRAATTPTASATSPDAVQATEIQEWVGITEDEKVTSEVLQEAFLIDLGKTELDHYGSKIEAVLAKK